MCANSESAVPEIPEPRYGLSTAEYLQRFLETANRSLSFERANLAPREWQSKLRSKLCELLQLDPSSLQAPAAHVETTTEKDGYRETRLHYQVEKDLWCPSLFLEPSQPSAPGAAVLACHGHGTGLEYPLYTYIEDFVRRGHVVFAPNVRDFGERAFETRMAHECPHVEPLYNLLGVSSLGLKVKDLLLGLEWLKARDEIDAERIGCAGLSMGGGLAMFLSAVQPSIAVTAVSGFLSTYKGLMLDVRNCAGYVVNGVLQHCDLYDVAGLIAPRPLVVESGTRDPCFVHEDALFAYERTRDIYAAFGAEDCIALDEFEGEHEFHGEVAYPWFDRFLARDGCR